MEGLVLLGVGELLMFGDATTFGDAPRLEYPEGDANNGCFLAAASISAALMLAAASDWFP